MGNGIIFRGGSGATLPTSIILPPGAAIFPDGSASNLAPQLLRVKSSAGAPSPYFYQINFDAAQTEQAVWQINAPGGYTGSPELRVQYKMASATSGDVRLDARVAAVTSGDTTDVDAKAFGTANLLTNTVPGTAGYVKTATIPLTNADSLTGADFALVYLARLGADGADTATGDMEVVSVQLSYA